MIAIDGKELLRSMDETLARQAIHMVSAWASDNRLVLAQQKVDEKSNEITAIPVLLEFVMNFWPRVVDSWHWHGTESLPD